MDTLRQGAGHEGAQQHLLIIRVVENELDYFEVAHLAGQENRAQSHPFARGALNVEIRAITSQHFEALEVSGLDGVKGSVGAAALLLLINVDLGLERFKFIDAGEVGDLLLFLPLKFIHRVPGRILSGNV